MADPYTRRSGPGRGPPKPFNGNQFPQSNPSQNGNTAASMTGFPAASYQSHGSYQQPAQVYQQPAHSRYQPPSESAYQQPSQSDYQHSNHANFHQPAQSSYQQPSQSQYQPAQQSYQYGYGADQQGYVASQQAYGSGNYGAQPQFGASGNSSPYQPQQSSGFAPSNEFMTGIATEFVKSQGENYFHRGQAYVQSKMGFLSAGDFHYLFDIDGSYVLDKIMLLLLPFGKNRSFARKSEQISGGRRYQPPRKDVFAPDLYIPFMAICTYVVLIGSIKYHKDTFSPENMYLLGSSALTGWAVQWLVLKFTLYLLSVSSGMPVLEILAYAGYPFFYACLVVLANISGVVWLYYVVLAYATIALGCFLVCTLKHVLFQDTIRHGSGSRYNYILAGLGAFQIPFLLWFHA